MTKELEEQGFDLRKIRQVCVAVNASETVENADKKPDFQIA